MSFKYAFSSGWWRVTGVYIVRFKILYATLDVFRGYLLSGVFKYFKYYVCSLVCLFNIFNWDVACLGTLLLCRQKAISTIDNQHFSLDRFSPPILIVFYSREDVSLMPFFDDHRRDSCRTGRFMDFTNQLPFWLLVRQDHLFFHGKNICKIGIINSHSEGWYFCQKVICW